MAEKLFNRESMRNLIQYKSLSSDEFDDLWDKELEDNLRKQDFEEQIKIKLSEFEKDYDLDELQFNDREALRALSSAIISLDYWEEFAYNLRQGEISSQDITAAAKVTNIASTLRSDISKLQDDLKISRKIRDRDKEETVKAEIFRLKESAAKYYKNKMFYVYCTTCQNLLSTLWVQYPEGKGRIKFQCYRITDDETGEMCGTVVSLSLEEISKMKGANITSLPEF